MTHISLTLRFRSPSRQRMLWYWSTGIFQRSITRHSSLPTDPAQGRNHGWTYKKLADHHGDVKWSGTLIAQADSLLVP